MNNLYNIQEIRLLPMDKTEEFKTETATRKFLATELVQRDGKYYYREYGIRVENGYALILFQYNAKIIGYGILKDVVKMGRTGEIDGKTIQYNGYFQFFTVSIHNVADITSDELQQIDNKITEFSQAKRFIDMKYYDQIYNLLLQKQIEFEQS